MTDLSTSTEPVPRGPLSERSGEITRGWRNYFEGRTRQLGEVISGVNQNRQSIVDLAVSVSDDLGDLSAAYISADAVVAANAESANATLYSTISAEWASGDTAVQANVTINANAIASLEGAVAIYEVIAAADGSQPARIRLKAGVGGATVELDADEVYFGAQTRFDLSTETFISTTGSVRARYGTAFGSGASVVLWHGPTSVAEGSESRTNGYLALGTDGNVYHNAAALNWGATAAEAAASNAVVPLGQNAAVDSEFQRDLYAWQTGWAGNTGLSHSVTKNTYGAGARHYYNASQSGTPTAGTVFDVLATKGTYLSTDLANSRLFGMPVRENDRVYAAARFSAIPARVSEARVVINWLRADGTSISTTNAGAGVPTDAAVSAIADWGLIGGFATAPANAVFAVIFFRAVCAGVADPYLAVTSPMIARVAASQTGAPNYTPGRPDPIGDQTNANTAAAITGQGLLALGNFYEQASDPGSVANGSLWAKTGTNELFIRASSVWKLVANIGNVLSISLSPTSYGGGSPSSTITGTASGGSGSYPTYAWSKVSGDTLTVTSPSSASTTFSSGSSASATYRLTVTDSVGATAYQDIGITIIVV